MGLALLFYVTATLVSGVAEGVTRLMNERSKMLWATLKRLLQSSGAVGTLGVPLMVRSVLRLGDARPTFGPVQGQIKADDVVAKLKELASAPSVRGVDYVTDGRTKVANIPGKIFAAALLEIATAKESGQSIQEKLVTIADHYASSPLGDYLRSLAENAGDDLDSVTNQISLCFDAQMVRVSQTYRKNIKRVLAGLGLVVALACNIDTIQVAHGLTTNANLRQVVVATAGKVDPDTQCDIAEKDPTVKTLKCGLQDLGTFTVTGVVIPTTDGWVNRLQMAWARETAVMHVLGLALTTGAVALGGPMWFDFLMLLTGRKRSG